METSERSLGAATHVCGSTAFAELAAGDVEQSLVHRFSDQVAKHRDCLAVRDPTVSLTYGELDRWASGIATAALELESDGKPLALVLEQGTASVAAILGALRARSPYVSLDPDDPRNAELIDRVGCRVVVTDAEHLDRVRAAARARSVLLVDDVEPGSPPALEHGPSDVAYVFFTSGSTGVPKAVYDSHRNVLHNVLRYTNTLRITPTDRLSLLQSPTFSGTVSTLFSALLNGASVFPFSLQRHGVGALANWILAEGITIYHSVPAIFRSLVGVAPGPYESVRLVRLEGDRATSSDVDLHRRHFPPNSVLVNGLGLTESGLVRQFFVGRDTHVDAGVLPVGYPVQDVDVVILGESGHELAPGSAGEIGVRSDYLALGYLDDPDLTEQRFGSVQNVRTYRTGDLGRLRADGCLEYLGRLDGELKILGSRVEPAEVESQLLLLPDVRDAAVTTIEGRRNEGRLVAAVVRAPGCSLSSAQVRDALALRLPAYMVPSTVAIVDELPISPSGKIDREALRELAAIETHAAPRSERERLVTEVWEHALDVSPIGVDEDFFALGGDSLAAAEIVVAIQERTGIALPPGRLVSAPTIASLARALDVAAADRSLVVLGGATEGTPLALCHGFQPGHKFLFADIARRITDRPVWEIDPPTGDASSLAEAVGRCLGTLRAAQPSGPYLLAGFCSGGIVAREVAMRLLDEGEEVPFLAILGISPVDFPQHLEPSVLARWERPTRRWIGLVRRDLGRARELPIREIPGWLVGRARAAARRALGARARQDGWSASATPFPGRVLLVLGEATTAPYTDDPARDWSSLASEPLDVVMLPGDEHDMLVPPLVDGLVSILDERLRAVSGVPARL